MLSVHRLDATLEKTLCSAVFIDTDLAEVIDATYDEIASKYEVVRHSKQEGGYRAFVLGIIKRLLMKGGIAPQRYAGISLRGKQPGN